MVGINSRKDSTDEECKVTSVEESVPQKSILDFFKSPGKPANKQQNLLGYFGKVCPSDAQATVNGHGKTQADDASTCTLKKIIGKKSSNRKTSTGADTEKTEKKTAKRKRNDFSDLVIGIDNDCCEDKRAKRKKKTNKMCKSLSEANCNEVKGEDCNSEKEETSKENFESEWKYERNPNDKLQKEFDTIAEEFQLCDSEVKGKEKKKNVNASSVGNSSDEEVVLLSDCDEVDSIAAVTCNGRHIESSNTKCKENLKTCHPCEEIKGQVNHVEGECKSSVDMKSNSTFEWKKTLDMEKIKTPKGKEAKEDKERKKKKRKMKLSKPEKCHKENVKPLNLSDVCENLADVSILSDSSQTESELKGQEVKMKQSEESTVVEVSFAEFLESAEVEASEKDSIVNAAQKFDVQGDEVDGKARKARNSKKEKQDYTSHKNTKEVEDPLNRNNVENDNTDVEVSYMDYLKSLSVEKDKESQKPDIEKASGKEKETDSDLCKDKKGNQTDEEEIPMPKQYPSITNFFKKVDKPQSQSKSSSAKVTVKADIHSRPSVSPPSAIVSDTQKRSPLSGSKLDQEIQILGSEIVNVETPKAGLKKKNAKESVESSHSGTEETCLESHNDKDEKETRRKFRKSLIKEMNKTCEDDEKEAKQSRHSHKKENQNEKDDEETDDCVYIMETKELDEKDNKMKQDFLQSGVSDVVLGKKTSQATFSFGKAGFQMKKGTPPVTRVRKSKAVKETDENFAESPILESTPLKDGDTKKSSRGRKKIQGVDILLPEKDSVLDTSGTTCRRSQKNQKADMPSTVNVEKECHGVNKKKGLEDMTVAERRKLIRRKYSVALLDQSDKHGSPIRIRLTRYSKSSTSQDDTLSPGSQRKLAKNKAKLKMTSTAQKLLEKAKRGKSLKTQKSEKGKKSMVEEESEKEVPPSPAKTGRRRSARLSDKQKSMEEVLIVDDESDDDCYTPTKPKAGRRGRAKSSSCTPKHEVRAPQKLAPIFMKKGKKEEPSTPVKKVLDPEAEKRRRAFLMSDVPEELRRQATSITTVMDADYPPLPKTNHVQQKGMNDLQGERNLWRLPDVLLTYRKDMNERGDSVQSGRWASNLVTKTGNNEDYTKIKNFTSYSKISEDNLELILSEIGRLNPIYPVKKMYSILREKKDDDSEESVSEKNNQKDSKPNEEEGKPKSRPRRSLRLRPVIEVIDVIGSPEKVTNTEEAQSEKQDSVPPALVFTEKYQPLNSSEVVGNTGLLKKLKSWLVEWKHRVDKEARKARLLMMKKSKGKQPKEEEDSGDWWADDASDFDMSSDDSEDEDSLCNTVMLTGPTGVGKTAAVYALAQELGFKVFEVNASSCRNGNRILTQLQEATQSHQVSKTSVGGSSTPVKIDKKRESGMDQKKKLPTAFTNLFKQAETQSKKDAPGKKGSKTEDVDLRKKKRKREEDEDVSKSSKKKKKDQEKEKPTKNSTNPDKVSGEVDSSKSLSLSSTSLILFDEVDIVFEQDKAFWAAVQSFMSTTKIPIILTSNDSKLHSKFEGRFEHYAFKIPSMITSAIYLQLVCLVENIRTDRQDIYNLISLNNGDIRKSLNTLQLWVLSGGGCTLKQQSIKNIEPKNVAQGAVNIGSMEESSQSNTTAMRDFDDKKEDDDDDFVTIKPVTKRRKPLLFDEDSNSVPPLLLDTGLCDVDQPVKHEELVGNASDLPPVHLSCVNTLLGCGFGSNHDFLKRLSCLAQDKESSWSTTAVEACIQYHSLKTNIIYNQHLELLSMSKKNVESSLLTKTTHFQREERKPRRRRIKLACELYDSEGSGEEDSDRKDTVSTEEKESNINYETINEKETCKNTKEEVKSLSSLHRFYDTLALTDVMRQVHEKSDLYGVSFGKEDPRGSICIGLDDQPVKYGNSLSSQDFGASLCSELELRSLIDLHKRQEEIMQSLEEVSEDTFSVPVTPCSISSVRNEMARCYISSKADLKRVNDNIMSNVPLWLHCQPAVIAMDYTPTLRSMCKNEQIREAAKAKRRFHHYLDSIGLPLKTTTISALCSSFT